MKGKLKLCFFGIMSLIGLILFVLFAGNVINIADEFQTLYFVVIMFLLYGGVAGLVSRYIKSKKQSFINKVLVERSDERNECIKNKAGRKAGVVTNYMSTVLLLIFSSFVNLPTWVIICQACVVISYPILFSVFFNKYYKE